MLINKDKTPILIDFGLSKTFLNVDTSVPTTGAAAGAQRWRAPELNEGQGQPKTTATDVYAVGMIIAEVCLPLALCLKTKVTNFLHVFG